MGLDITVYKNLKVVENPQFDGNGELENWNTEWTPGDSMRWSEEHFPGRGQGIDPDKVYTWEDTFQFRAGSYSGYNRWRAQLEKFKGNEAFQELINFADNEGVIGPIVSKKLAEDFQKHEDEAKAFAIRLGDVFDDTSSYWFELYKTWKEAFEMASENGAVEFR
ncbi:hypothetical protein [Bacillus paralicheniformis]|uniref:hypothetical protein n=1 Tax=Bacillus paralicheniformis TaxID=1648923 RepID=UPI0018A125FF|nr:hypothetical protein [Bacillus paralicheniformis]